MRFCEDVDLFCWEPGIFLEDSFAHQAIIRGAAGTLSGTALVMGAAVLGSLAPGMVAKIELASDAAVVQVVEITAVGDASHATVSMLRGRADEGAIVPLVSGSVKVTVVSFVPQIAAVGDGLLALLGVGSDRDGGPDRVVSGLVGFRTACVFGVLAAIFRTLMSGEGSAAVLSAMKVKEDFYESLARTARRQVSGLVDVDGDGVAERRMRAGVSALCRG